MTITAEARAEASRRPSIATITIRNVIGGLSLVEVPAWFVKDNKIKKGMTLDLSPSTLKAFDAGDAAVAHVWAIYHGVLRE